MWEILISILVLFFSMLIYYFLKKAVHGTTEHDKGNKPNKTETTCNVSPEVNKLKDNVEHTEEVVPEVNKGRDKVEHTEEVVPEVNKGRDKIEQTKKVVPEVNKGRDEVEQTKVLPEVNKGRDKVEHTEEVVPEVNKGRDKIEQTKKVVPEVNKGRDKIEQTKKVLPEVKKGRDEVEQTKVLPEVNKGRDKVEHTEEVVPEVNKGRDQVEHTEEVEPEVNKGRDKVEHTEEVEPEVNKGKDKVEQPEEVEPEVHKGRDQVEHTEEVEPEVNKGKDRVENTEEVEPEVKKGRDKVQHTEEVLPEVNKARDKVEHTEEVEPEVNKGKDKVEQPEEVLPEVNTGRDRVEHTEEVEPEVRKGRYQVEHTEEVEPEVNKGKDRVENTEEVEPEVNKGKDKVEQPEEVEPEGHKGRDQVEHTEEVLPEVNTGRDRVEHTEEVEPKVKKGSDEQTKNVLPEVSKGRDKVEQPEEVLPEVSKKRGKVPLLEYSVLRKHRVEMVNKLELEKVIPLLKQNNVLDKDDVEIIEKKRKDLRRKGAETMLSILYNSGNWPFSQLIAALKKAGYQEMAKTLIGDLEKKTAVPQSVDITKQRGFLSEIEFEVLRDNHERLVNELDSSILKNHLLKNEVIDEDELEKISKKEEKLKKEGAEEMVNIIHYSGANAFSKFITSLDEAGYDKLSSKLETDLKQKKKEKTYEGMKIDLNLVAFPDYPITPQICLKDIQGDDDISDWFQIVNKWFNTGKLWCDVMNYWFKDHEFYNKEEVKVVVKDWLLKLEEDVDKRLIGRESITAIFNAAEIVLELDNDHSPLHLKYNKEKLLKFFKMYGLERKSMKEKEEYVQNEKAHNQKLLEQQRQGFKKLKHNLEGIIEGNQNKLLPIDSKSCLLVKYFTSVCNDVKELWNKLQ